MSITHAELPKVEPTIRVIHGPDSVIAWLIRPGYPDLGWAVSYFDHGGDVLAAEVAAIQSATARLEGGDEQSRRVRNCPVDLAVRAVPVARRRLVVVRGAGRVVGVLLLSLCHAGNRGSWREPVGTDHSASQPRGAYGSNPFDEREGH